MKKTLRCSLSFSVWSLDSLISAKQGATYLQNVPTGIESRFPASLVLWPSAICRDPTQFPARSKKTAAEIVTLMQHR
jgi:hypothetical protein